MEWNRENRAKVGKAIQDARLRQGMTLGDVSLAADVKSCVVSSLEKGRHLHPPRLVTQAKLEKALGVVLPIERGTPQKVSIYVSAECGKYIQEQMTKLNVSRSSAISIVMKKWSEHEAALARWNAEHPGSELKG